MPWIARTHSLMPNVMASPNWSRFGSEWNMGGFGSSLCPQSFDNFWFSRLIDGPLAHWGVWMGINTLRVGPLLCPDNVGILIFERYFLKFFRVQLFLSFFNFLSHLVLSQKYLHCFRGSSFVPTLPVKERGFRSLPDQSHFGLRFLTISKS